MVQEVAEKWEPHEEFPVLKENGGINFIFAGGEESSCKIKAWLPHEIFADGMAINVAPCTATPLLIALEMLRYCGMGIDYHNNTVYSHRLKRRAPAVVLKIGQIAVSLLPSEEAERTY